MHGWSLHVGQRNGVRSDFATGYAVLGMSEPKGFILSISINSEQIYSTAPLVSIEMQQQ